MLSEIHVKHQQLCADLNMDKETATNSWNNYLAAKHNYTLEGNQLHWLACAMYVACRKSSVPAIGRMNTFIEGNLVSLTRLLRSCELTLIQFIDKCRKWANMVSLTSDFIEKINSLERKLAVSTVVFKNFRSIFYDMFEDQDSTIMGYEKMKIYKKGKSITCTTSRLMEFTWTLYLVVKSEFLDTSEDLVSSYHLLLACCDLIYANAICSDRRDILNRKFAGIPEHFFDDDYDPPSEPICVIDELCKNHEGIPIDAKGVREYSWKFQIKKLFEREVLTGDATRFTDILSFDVFDTNYRSINRCYEQYVLSMGDFDERVMLVENQTDTEDNSGERKTGKNGRDESEDDVKQAPSIIHPNTLTPLTGRHHLNNRDVSINVGSVTPMMTAKESVIRLHTMLKTPRVFLKQSLKNANFTEEAIAELENEIRSRVAEMIECCRKPSENVNDDQAKFTEFTRKRLDIAAKLFYKILDDIIQTEIKMSKPDVAVSLRQDFFLKSLFACSVEIVVFSYGCSQLKFPWVLDVLQLQAYHFYKIIELVVRTENQLSRDMVKHMNMLEEKILDSLSWISDSPLWKTIQDSNMPVPNCEEVCLPHQLATMENSQAGSFNLNFTTHVKTNRTESNDDLKHKPKRGGSLGLFFRKFYHLASVRMQDLCQQLNITEKDVLRTIWTCFEHVIVANVNLMENRHLDQILMCTVYVACKVLEIELTFQEIMKCYRGQPQSASNIYRSVLLTPICKREESSDSEERGDLIKFYNSVYVKVIQNFVLKFSTKSNRGTPLVLSPLPVSKSKVNSPYRRLSGKHSIYIRCLDNHDVAPSPVKSLSYYFSRSPAKDLHAINNMIQINTVKRSLNALEDEELSIKKVPRHDLSKVQDMMEDRRKYKVQN